MDKPQHNGSSPALSIAPVCRDDTNPVQSRGAKSFVDDLGLSRGVVSSRAAFSLRSIETKPFDWEICSLQKNTSPGCPSRRPRRPTGGGRQPSVGGLACARGPAASVYFFLFPNIFWSPCVQFGEIKAVITFFLVYRSITVVAR